MKKKDRNNCLNCGAECKRHGKIYCSNKCQGEYMLKQYFEEVEKTGDLGKRAQHSARRAKKYLLNKYGHRCQICGTETWNGEPVPLVFDHIDGKATNTKVENCRLICPNCDRQLPTWGSRNTGNGRKSLGVYKVYIRKK